MISLTTFPTLDALLDVLEPAGLAGQWQGKRFHDQSCVDVFPVWPRVNSQYTVPSPNGDVTTTGWHDDLTQATRFTANIARELTVDEWDLLREYVVQTPAAPRRVFA